MAEQTLVAVYDTAAHADADGATDELSLEEITVEESINGSAAGLPEANGDGGGEVA